MIESASVALPTNGASAASASGALCGFTAMTTALAGVGLAVGLSATPRRVSAFTLFTGCGSRIVSWRGSSPRASQPSSMAEPILPAPSKTRRPENFRSGFSAALAGLLCRFLTRFMATSYRHFGCYASPDVSNIAESIASRADLPAQMTN